MHTCKQCSEQFESGDGHRHYFCSKFCHAVFYRKHHYVESKLHPQEYKSKISDEDRLAWMQYSGYAHDIKRQRCDG
jgi:hypothetical protein